MSHHSFSVLHSGGSISLIIGPMFSGKTTELLRRIRRFNVAKKKCLVIKYRKDTRYSADCMSTHDKQMIAAKSAEKLCEVDSIASDYDVIGIDEGQFFPDLVPHCEAWANDGKVVIIGALDGTFQRQAFGSVLDLVPLAENVTKLSAVCMLCNADASFTRRLGAERGTVVIGGADKYIAVCRGCFTEPVAEDQQQPVEEKENIPAESKIAKKFSELIVGESRQQTIGAHVGRDL